MQLKDKVVFITGGAQGFGRAVGEAVLKKGGKVCLADVKVDQGEKSAGELQRAYGQDNVIFVKCDVTNATMLEDAFKTAVSKFGQIDVMCNNAGIMDESIWEKQIDINFSGVVRGTMLAINHMRTDKGGKGGVIINTASLAGLFPTYWFPVYAGTKSAVQHFTTSWAHNPEIKSSGIRFASICPNGAKTALLDLREDQVIQLQSFKQTMDQIQYCTVEQVVEAFLKVMEEDDLNGQLVTIRAKEGVVCMKLTPTPSSL